MSTPHRSKYAKTPTKKQKLKNKAKAAAAATASAATAAAGTGGASGGVVVMPSNKAAAGGTADEQFTAAVNAYLSNAGARHVSADDVIRGLDASMVTKKFVRAAQSVLRAKIDPLLILHARNVARAEKRQPKKRKLSAGSNDREAAKAAVLAAGGELTSSTALPADSDDDDGAGGDSDDDDLAAAAATTNATANGNATAHANANGNGGDGSDSSEDSEDASFAEHAKRGSDSMNNNIAALYKANASTPATAAASVAAAMAAAASTPSRSLASVFASSVAGSSTATSAPITVSLDAAAPRPATSTAGMAAAATAAAAAAVEDLTADADDDDSAATPSAGAAGDATPAAARKPRRERASGEPLEPTTETSRPVSSKKAAKDKRKAAKAAAGGGTSATPGSGGKDRLRAKLAVAAGATPSTAGSGGVDSKAVEQTLRFSDLGGIDHILIDIRELIEYPLIQPRIYAHLGVDPPRGVLLHGPPGCGKTMLAHAIAGELGVPLIKVGAPELVSGMSGESEARIRDLFQDALNEAPCIVFIDEIDAITPKRETAQREMERRIVAQLLTSLDDLSPKGGKGDPLRPVIVIGATNRPDGLDPALRRAGRFDREISMGIPDDAGRERMLRVMCRKLRVDPACDFGEITRKTAGFVGADLVALTREAAVLSVRRAFGKFFESPAAAAAATAATSASPSTTITTAATAPAASSAITTPLASSAATAATAAGSVANTIAAAGMDIDSAAAAHVPQLMKHTAKAAHDSKELIQRAEISARLRQPLSETQLSDLWITTADFEIAATKVQPSAKREGFATVPNVSWDDIGALEELRDELNYTILQPITNPEQYTALGLNAGAGVLLFGPPGCGKTLIAKAIANESGASFLSVKGPELLSQYVGESERAVRQVFQRARMSAPCVIFFDELDALAPKRGQSDGGGSHYAERLVNQLLTEMDGLDERRAVFVIGATNRPDTIDSALMRPGRLDKSLYVRLPDAAGRHAILVKHTRSTPLAADVNLMRIASDARAEGFSGADMANLVREAAIQALRDAQSAKRADEIKRAAAAGGSGGGSDLKGAFQVTKYDKNSKRSAPLDIKVYERHFQAAFGRIRPSVTDKQRKEYDRMAARLGSARAMPDATAASTTELDATKPPAAAAAVSAVATPTAAASSRTPSVAAAAAAAAKK